MAKTAIQNAHPLRTQPLRIVAVGGGTGLYTTLSALKKIAKARGPTEAPPLITAVVSVADDGGSTGRLRDEFGTLPHGDLRRALVALSADTGALRELFTYRFSKGDGLKGHSMGNLLLTALSDLYGDYGAIQRAGRILRVKGRVVPVTLEKTRLCAELEDGTLIKGETNIDIPKHNPQLTIQKAFLEPAPEICTAARRAIETADLIIIGPGDLYTSLVPNLLVAGFGEAVAAAQARAGEGNQGARVLYITNTMTKYGETNGFTAKQFVQAIEEHLAPGTITHVLCNTTPPSPDQQQKYTKEHAEFVTPDVGVDVKPNPQPDRRWEMSAEKNREMNTEKNTQVHVYRRALLGEQFARHDQEKLATALKEIISEVTPRAQKEPQTQKETRVQKGLYVQKEPGRLDIPTIIFDLDDTLIRTTEKLVPHARANLKQHLIEEKKAELYDSIITRRKEVGLSRAIKEHNINGEKALAATFNIPLKEQIAYEDVALLHELKKNKRAHLKLLTRGKENYQMKKIKLHGFDELFDEIEIVSMEGSKRDAIRRLADRTQHPKRTFVVGDKGRDEIAAAVELGHTPIQIIRDGLEREAHPDAHIITTLHELENILNEERRKPREEGR